MTIAISCDSQNSPSSTSKIDALCGCKGVRFCKLCAELKPKFQSTFLDGLQKYNDYKFYCYNSARENHVVLFENLSIYSTIREIKMASEKAIECPSEELPISRVQLIPNFISEKEEINLTEKIDANPWQLSQSGRRKQDYGPKVNFKQQKVKFDTFLGIPDYADFLLQRLDNYVINDSIGPFQLFEMCNLEYATDRNACIDMHMDDCWIWGERLISINLLSDTVLCLENENNKHIIFIYLQRRSILVLSGELRNDWKHGIFSHHIAKRRLVITMREAADSFKENGENYELYGHELQRRAKLRIK